ncbi:hypothetical protein, partial [Enterobacter intestinihominis]
VLPGGAALTGPTGARGGGVCPVGRRLTRPHLAFFLSPVNLNPPPLFLYKYNHNPHPPHPQTTPQNNKKKQKKKKKKKTHQKKIKIIF